MNINLEIYGSDILNKIILLAEPDKQQTQLNHALFSTTYLASNRAPDTSTETITLFHL
jgi:hypothetical protein